MNADQEKALRKLIREQLSIYGTRRFASTLGGFGRMFKLGVDYKNANTNIPQVRVGSMARYPEIPVKILIASNWNGQAIYDELFEPGYKTDRVDFHIDRYMVDKGDLVIFGRAITGDGIPVEAPHIVKGDVEKSVGYLTTKVPDIEFKVRAELIN